MTMLMVTSLKTTFRVDKSEVFKANLKYLKHSSAK